VPVADSRSSIATTNNERYADHTKFGDVVLTLRHMLRATPGGTRVTHELVIDGPGAGLLRPELGPQRQPRQVAT
jgi:hypothetical protein